MSTLKLSGAFMTETFTKRALIIRALIKKYNLKCDSLTDSELSNWFWDNDKDIMVYNLKTELERI